MKYQIKQLGVGGVLDHTVSLMKDNFGLLFGIVLVTLVPAYVVQGLIEIQMMDSIVINPRTGQAQVDPMASLPLALVSLLVSIVVLPLANAAIIYGVGSTYLSRPTTVGECLRKGMQRWGALIWTMFLMGLIIGIGLILLIIPGIIFAMRYSLAQEVAVLEDESGSDALSRSRDLMKGNWGALFVLSLLIGVISAAMGFGAALIPEPYTQKIAIALLQSLATAFGACALVVFYFSARCKHENFDLQILAQSVEAEASQR